MPVPLADRPSASASSAPSASSPSARRARAARAPLSAGLAALVGACLLGDASAAAPGPGSPGRKFTTLERMTIPRLEALHADVQALHARRRAVGLSTGLNDYHGNLHCHADDSAHTGGTVPEMIADAKSVGVDVIVLSDHFRPPRDFIDGRPRGVIEGVLFLPGSETHGMLIAPDRSVLEHMEKPLAELLPILVEGTGLAFLSHPEYQPLATTEGMTGMEIYNNHADAMDDMMGLMAGLMGRMTDPAQAALLTEGLEKYPAEMLAALADYPMNYMKKWDEETATGRRVVGVAANDCHHNQIYMVQVEDAGTVRVGTNVDKPEDMRKIKAVKPGLIEMMQGREPGDTLVRLDFDPYHRSFRNCATHILAPERTEPAIRAALRAGHCYVAHDWLCDPTGFFYGAFAGEERVAIMGDEVAFREGLRIVAEFPLACRARLIRDGEEIESVEDAAKYERAVDRPGVYRVEGWVSVGGEDRVWIYSNPIYVHGAASEASSDSPSEATGGNGADPS